MNRKEKDGKLIAQVRKGKVKGKEEGGKRASRKVSVCLRMKLENWGEEKCTNCNRRVTEEKLISYSR